jgi:hypothetical protein
MEETAKITEETQDLMENIEYVTLDELFERYPQMFTEIENRLATSRYFDNFNIRLFY